MLWLLPLEPLEERYTSEWRHWFRDHVQSREIEATFIDGAALTGGVEVGSVLDAAGTNFWKARQMQEVCRLFHGHRVRTGDKFFVFDLWYPGLEMIPYMAHLFKAKVEIYGFMFAGSYVSHDFTELMAYWARHFEKGWASMCTKVFFGSHSHRKDFENMRPTATELVVTGSPFDSAYITPVDGLSPVRDRAKIIAFPHRWDPEKCPGGFITALNRLWHRRQDFTAMIMTGRQRFHDPEGILNKAEFPCTVMSALPKHEYHRILAACKIVFSSALEETWGYCTTEGAALGCHPVAPNTLCHPEILPEQYLYNSMEEAVDMLHKALDHPVSVPRAVIDGYDKSLGNIFREMGF